MALQASGPISFSNVNSELGLASTTSINLNQSTVRILFKKTTAGSAISMSDGYGKSRMPSTIEVLIVAGGGHSGGESGGGGGGLIEWVSIVPVAATNYSIVVGAGSTTAARGGDSSGFGKTALGGGYGASYLGSGSPGGSGGGGGQRYRGGGNPGGSGFDTGITISGITFSSVTHVAKQGNTGGSGFSNGSSYAGSQGGGYTSRGANGYEIGGVGVYDNGYVTDVYLRQVPPFNSFNSEVVTRLSAGGGYGTAYSGNSDTPLGAAKWYGGGNNAFGGGAKQGVLVIRYSGTIVGTGGNNITYNVNDDKSYHVFTSSGTFRFD